MTEQTSKKEKKAEKKESNQTNHTYIWFQKYQRMLGNITLCNATQHALLLYVKMIETLIMCSSILKRLRMCLELTC